MGQTLSLAICVGVPLASSTVSVALNRRKSNKWYQDLRKPKWTPPNWLFGLMDVAFHVSMGTGSWFMWKKGFEDNKVPLILYGAQLLLGMLYNPMFYHCHELNCAMADIFLVDVLATTACVMFYKKTKTGGNLMMPFVAYAYFCTALTGQTICNEEEAKKEKKDETGVAAAAVSAATSGSAPAVTPPAVPAKPATPAAAKAPAPKAEPKKTT